MQMMFLGFKRTVEVLGKVGCAFAYPHFNLGKALIYGRQSLD
jgi:hypothetical protein